jgi:uncharacterized SAM-binding protein YcdF (DUF218 family)
MFVVAKIVGYFVQPSNFIALLAVLGLVLSLFRSRRLGTAALSVAALLLAVFGISSSGLVALGTLENRFPVPGLDSPVTGMILLGGAVDTHISAERGQNTTNDAGERITAVAELNRRFPDARIVLSGGANHILTAQPLSESAVARQLLIDLGVDAKRIEMEEVSRDTCENAEDSLVLVKPKANETWLLVTSASHMPRAVACFRAIGFAIIPYPVDYRTQGTESVLTPSKSVADGLAAADLAAHEWIGLAGYWLSGRTGDPFPAP